MLIGGEWVDAADGGDTAVLNPATEEELSRLPVATSADVAAALAATAAGFERWRDTDAWTRSAVLRRAAALVEQRADRLAALLTAEQGKPLVEARSEVLAAAGQLDWFADEARRVYGRVVPALSAQRHQFVLREPIGPVAAFTPWNFPALLVARKIAPALAAGCSVLLKPAEEAPGVALALAEALLEAGLPPGVLNIVTGDPAAISSQVLASPVVRKLSLTGSLAVGRQLAARAADQVLDLSLELGGHAPVLVLDDVDPVDAARRCVAGKFRNAGQVCIAATRFYVQHGVYEAFLGAFTEAVAALRVGDGAQAGTDVGPLSNARRLQAVERLVDDARDRGAVVTTGGRRRDDGPGFFYEPTVLADVDGDARMLHEEPFGPIAPVMPVADLDEALHRANASSYGLAGYVLTGRTDRAFAALRGLEVGIVGVNTFEVSSPALPFGGVKQSGVGRESGPEAIEGYTTSKAVTLDLG